MEQRRNSMNGTDFLTGSRRIRKLYEARISRVCGRYGLTQIETDILAFLSNHPGKDTAGDTKQQYNGYSSVIKKTKSYYSWLV